MRSRFFTRKFVLCGHGICRARKGKVIYMKRKVLNKVLAGAMCVVMTAGLAACGNSDSGQTASSQETSKAAESTAASEAASTAEATTEAAAPAEDREEITLTIMGGTGNDGISTDDGVGRYLKEKLGITLEYQAYSTDRMKVMASGGDLPDIVCLNNGEVDISTLIDSGMVWCMDDWLESNGDNIKAQIPTAMKYAKEVVGGGKTYFVPTNVQYANPDLPNKNGFVGFYTRWDYYKELGYPEVTNEDEYLDLLKQMQDAHPTTSDGKKVYALSAWTDWGLWPYTIAYPFSHGYNNIDNNQLSNEVTNEIEDMFTKEDGIFWKGLAFFNKAYRMGIMDPEAFTMKAAQYNEKVKSGAVLTCEYNWVQPDKAVCGDDAADYLIAGAFPYASQIYLIDNAIGYGKNNCLAISANCKYPERAMELIDYLLSDEGRRLVNTGVEGVDWQVTDGKPELIGKRLENVKTNKTAYPDYDSEQGITRYYWLSALVSTLPCSDGEPANLASSKEYIIDNVTASDKDMCDHYTGGKAQYPGEAYVELVNEGKMQTASGTNLAAKLMEPVSDEASRVFAKADEYFQANIAKIITCADDAAFEAQKAKMISDVNAMGYEDALKEVQASFEKAQETVKSFQ